MAYEVGGGRLGQDTKKFRKTCPAQTETSPCKTFLFAFLTVT